MKKRRVKFDTNAIYRCKVTFKNGRHKILRIAIDLVAKLTYEFREFQKNIFRETWLLCIRENEFINITEIQSCKFINERTGKEFLTIE